jgi:hypothetical protein
MVGVYMQVLQLAVVQESKRMHTESAFTHSEDVYNSLSIFLLDAETMQFILKHLSTALSLSQNISTLIETLKTIQLDEKMKLHMVATPGPCTRSRTSNLGGATVAGHVIFRHSRGLEPVRFANQLAVGCASCGKGPTNVRGEGPTVKCDTDANSCLLDSFKTQFSHALLSFTVVAKVTRCCLLITIFSLWSLHLA